jgi:SAM-dependent methyltransferase
LGFQDHFSARADLYARARPTYPAALFADLAALAPGRRLAWDCGTGNGQAAVGLAACFSMVIATDPSSAQLDRAEPHPRVEYRVGAEEASGLPPASVDLVTAAQAAHWFNQEKFHAEARRVLRPRGLLAIWCYGLCEVTPGIDRLVASFYRDTVGRYWPPDRAPVEDGYRSLPFPLPEEPFPAHVMERRWLLGEFGAYLGSWSAVERFHRANGTDPVAPFLAALTPEWGDAPRLVRWPLTGRLGRMTS